MPGGLMEWRASKLPEVKTAEKAKGMSLQEYNSLIDSDKLILVDFYADWCAPCQKMRPYLERMAKQMADQVTLVRIDADKNTELCEELTITALPVLRLYNGSQLMWENEGFIGEAEVRQQIKIHSGHD